MPANQHPDEVKVVHSVDRIGICIWTSIVTRRVALSMTGQLPLKRPFEGPADEHGGFSSYGNACVVLTAQCHFLLQCGRGVGRSCNFECNALMICSCLWIVLPLLVLCTVCPVYMPSSFKYFVHRAQALLQVMPFSVYVLVPTCRSLVR